MKIAFRHLSLTEEKQAHLDALARSAGVAPSTVKSIINGASKNPGIVTIKMLCDGLNISLTDFFDTEAFRNLEQEIR